jgi:hypothetical protein
MIEEPAKAAMARQVPKDEGEPGGSQ